MLLFITNTHASGIIMYVVNYDNEWLVSLLEQQSELQSQKPPIHVNTVSDSITT